MKFKIILSLLFIISIFICCKKSSHGTDAPPQADCVTNNYGILQLYYGDATRTHSTTVQSTVNNVPTGNKITKITAIGVLRDTMHLWAGPYFARFDALEPNGQVFKEYSGQISPVPQCDTTRAFLTN